MKRIKTEFERRILQWAFIFFVLAMIIGFGGGYYRHHQQAKLLRRLRRERELYKQMTMERLNYQIRYLSVARSNSP